MISSLFLASPQILQQTVVPIISPAVCRQIWGRSRITDSMICVGASGSSSCQVYEERSRRNTLPYQCCCSSVSNVCFPQGDSGGPLVCESSGVWTLVGSVSWEISTCDPRSPAVYARISQLRSWIGKTINSN